MKLKFGRILYTSAMILEIHLMTEGQIPSNSQQWVLSCRHTDSRWFHVKWSDKPIMLFYSRYYIICTCSTRIFVYFHIILYQFRLIEHQCAFILPSLHTAQHCCPAFFSHLAFRRSHNVCYRNGCYIFGYIRKPLFVSLCRQKFAKRILF